MRDFVSYPSAGNERLHCTMKRTEDDPEVGGPCYTLYLEYLGGLVPILKGRRISKLRPEFVIMDPRTDSKTGGSLAEGLSPCSPVVMDCHYLQPMPKECLCDVSLSWLAWNIPKSPTFLKSYLSEQFYKRTF